MKAKIMVAIMGLMLLVSCATTEEDVTCDMTDSCGTSVTGSCGGCAAPHP